MSLSRSSEEILAALLEECDPSKVVENNRCREAFQNFIARLNSSHRHVLLTTESRGSPSDATGHEYPSTPSQVPGSSSALSSRSERRETSSETESWVEKMARAFFRPHAGSASRLVHMVRVVRGIYDAVQYSQVVYESIWLAEDGVFSSSDPGESRLRRLADGRKRLEQGQSKFEIANRIALIYLAHDIEVLKMKEWQLKSGETRQSAAVKWIAGHLNITTDVVKAEWRRSQNYIRLIEICGPGSLIELGTGVNWYWEKCLAKNDVASIVEFRKRVLPDINARAQSLNTFTGQIIINGMIAYGWTMEELLVSPSRLQIALLKYCPELLKPTQSTAITSPYSHTPLSETAMTQPVMDRCFDDASQVLDDSRNNATSLTHDLTASEVRIQLDHNFSPALLDMDTWMYESDLNLDLQLPLSSGAQVYSQDPVL